MTNPRTTSAEPSRFNRLLQKLKKYIKIKYDILEFKLKSMVNHSKKRVTEFRSEFRSRNLYLVFFAWLLDMIELAIPLTVIAIVIHYRVFWLYGLAWAILTWYVGKLIRNKFDMFKENAR